MSNENFWDDLAESMIGSIAMDSVVLPYVNHVAEKYGYVKFDTYEDAIELCNKNHVDVAECPECGWISEGNWYEHPDHDGVCSDCEVEKEY